MKNTSLFSRPLSLQDFLGDFFYCFWDGEGISQIDTIGFCVSPKYPDFGLGEGDVLQFPFYSYISAEAGDEDGFSHGQYPFPIQSA